MTKKCSICDEKINEEYGKIKGTMLKTKNKDNKNEIIYVCNICQKKEGWIETAKTK